MELVPIIYRVLLMIGGLFSLVLIISFISSRFVKRSDNKIQKEIVHQRKIAYSREQLKHLARMRQIEQSSIGHQSYASKTIQKYPVQDKMTGLNNKHNTEFETMPKKYSSGEKKFTKSKEQRYSVLNKTMRKNDDPAPVINETKIFYPIDFQRSA
ncbi:MAG: hypothetical protein CVV23_00655 [Ignavibacteriae bacterium HGW-Ignavibacteriae-2]|nr:MAG: hypothetical protein CVV23_00655 [Ignavibacteriae bacterium HGW-Ignavibacteriae-2]